MACALTSLHIQTGHYVALGSGPLFRVSDSKRYPADQAIPAVISRAFNYAWELSSDGSRLWVALGRRLNREAAFSLVGC